MARTNIDLDEDLVATVMRRYRLPSKRAAVDFALRQLTIEPMGREQVLAMRGSGFELTNEEIEGDWTAAVALRLDVPVLHRDRDFEVLAELTPLHTASLLDRGPDTAHQLVRSPTGDTHAPPVGLRRRQRPTA